MDDNVHAKVDMIYFKKNKKNEDYIKERRKELYEKFPEIFELKQKLTNIMANTTRKMIFATDSEKEEIQKNAEAESKKIRREIKRIYKENNISLNYCEPKYECPICKDKGYTEEGSIINKCICYKQTLIKEKYKITANLDKLNKENFKTFDSSWYSAEQDVERYGSKISPRKNIENIKNTVLKFIDEFDTTEDHGLLFSGKPGLGKTFMSNCIAKELLDRGYTVMYQTAPELFDTIIRNKFSNKLDEYEKFYEIYNDVDLLIIDDAGAENMNTQRQEELFNLINNRIIRNKKTIISTNLSIDELYVNYDERVISRILGTYKKIKFFGEDIRLKKI